MNRFWRILLWVLFWYYLAPYYLFKKFVFKNRKHKIAWSALGSVITVFVLFCCWVNSLHDDEDATSNTASAPKTHVVVKKVGVQRLAKDQAKEKVLNTEEKKKQKEYDKLVAELDAAKKAQQEAKKHSSEQTTVTHHRSTATTHHSSSGNGAGRGDMDTADSGKIVGNKNTKIYHVPGQAGYRMNSANAVYFNSEQDAINAGYRKAKR